MTPEEHRRRIDAILDRSFLEALEAVSAGELRERLRDARTEEDAISYIRRNLHGRIDMLKAELQLRRSGRGTSSDVATLTAALVDAPTGPSNAHRGSHTGVGLRAAAVAGSQHGEQILGEDHLARLPELSEDEISQTLDRVAETEQQLSDQRRRLHEVIDTLEAELADRYKSGLEPSLERLQ